MIQIAFINGNKRFFLEERLMMKKRKIGHARGHGHGHERKKGLRALFPSLFRARARARVRARSSLLSLFFLLLLLASCERGRPSNPPEEQALRMSIHTEPPTMDSRRATDTTSINLIHMCFEGLLREDGPGVASRFEASDDKMRYTFYLRDAKWSDGTPVTAFDFADTWTTILSPNFPSEFANELFVIKNGRAFKAGKAAKEDLGIKVIDDKTLEVNLEHPTTYFTQLVATSYFFPYKNDVGNGPFKMVSWKHYDEMIMIKSETYWDKDKVKLQKLFFPIIQDETTELSMYESGELDWAGQPFSTIPLDSLQTILKTHTMQTIPLAGVYYYIFNTEKPPFNNVNMRKAFTLAINRQTIIDNILQGKQMMALSYIPPNLWKEKSKPAFSDHDIADAKKFFALGLKELGGKLPTITLSYNTSEGHHKIAQAIQQQWKEAFGVDVQLENKEWKVFLSEINKHQYQVARLGGLAAYNDPVTFLDEANTDRTGWKNADYDKFIEMARQATDAKTREELLHQAETVLLEDMPLAPIYFYTSSYLEKPYVKGVVFTNTGQIDLKYAYIHH